MGFLSNSALRPVKKIASQAEALADAFAALTDEQLKTKTAEFKERHQNGESLDALLPEVFAQVREASWRVIGLKHFYEQIMGGVVLHQGNIAEMKTGEGKTLVATLPAVLNAIPGKGVHIITVNDYLASRDAEWMGKVYRFLGYSVGLVRREQDRKQKQASYGCDILYSTNNELGFDYLRDNMVVRKEDLVQRDFSAAAPGTKWFTDITELSCADGKAYLCGILDGYDRALLGHSMENHMRAELCTTALMSAARRFGHEPGCIAHSDRGSQFTSRLYREVLDKQGFRQSMSRTGCCYDNAVMESFFGTLKTELIYQLPLSRMTRAEVRHEIFAWIEAYYNRRRRHTANERNLAPLVKRALHQQANVLPLAA